MTTKNTPAADDLGDDLTPEELAAIARAEAGAGAAEPSRVENVDPETGEITSAPAAKISDLARADQATDEAGRLIITRRVLMIKSLLPDENWIAREVVAKGKGLPPVWLGRIFGNAIGWELKTNTQSDGRVTESIALRGKFESESLHGLEPQQGTTTYLPMAYAEQAAAIFQAAGVGSGQSSGGMVVSIDCDLGLEATGKPIPYAWVVKAFLKGKQMDTLRNLRNQRRVGQPLPEAPALPGATPAPALAAPAASEAPAGLATLADGEAPVGLKNVTPGAE